MKPYRTFLTALCAALLIGSVSASVGFADPAQPQVVTDSEIQNRIDQQSNTEAADRQAIRDLLARPQVRQIAGSAGLDIQRANDAVSTLSGPELQRVAAQARDANAQIGGEMRVSWPLWVVIIVILVVIIILI